MVGSVVLRTVAAAAEGDRGFVAAPGPGSGMPGWPIGDSGLVGGVSETVAFGSDAVWARGEAGAVGTADPGRGTLAVFSAMVGAPTGVLEVASFMVGMPAVGVKSGLVADPMGVRGFVPALTVGESGMVGAPVAIGGLTGAAAVGARGIVGMPVAATVGLMGVAVGAIPVGPAVLSGIVGAGAGVGGFGGPATGAVMAGMAGAPAGGAIAWTGTSGLGAAAAESLMGSFGSVGGRGAKGIAGGASAALRVTRTVSFFKGTLEVILEAGILSFSLMRGGFCI